MIGTITRTSKAISLAPLSPTYLPLTVCRNAGRPGWAIPAPPGLPPSSPFASIRSSLRAAAENKCGDSSAFPLLFIPSQVAETEIQSRVGHPKPFSAERVETARAVAGFENF